MGKTQPGDGPKAIRALKILLEGQEVSLAGQRVRLLDGELVAVLTRVDSHRVPIEDAYVPFDLTLTAFLKAAEDVKDEDLFLSEAAVFVANAERALTQINREGGPSHLPHNGQTRSEPREGTTTGTPAGLSAGHGYGADRNRTR